jgi:hypothetical protein
MTAVLVAGLVLAAWVLVAVFWLAVARAAAKPTPPPPPSIRGEDWWFCRRCVREGLTSAPPMIGHTPEDWTRHVALTHQPAPVDVVDR